jgi:hypothetical protein
VGPAEAGPRAGPTGDRHEHQQLNDVAGDPQPQRPRSARGSGGRRQQPGTLTAGATTRTHHSTEAPPRSATSLRQGSARDDGDSSSVASASTVTVPGAVHEPASPSPAGPSRRGRRPRTAPRDGGRPRRDRRRGVTATTTRRGAREDRAVEDPPQPARRSRPMSRSASTDQHHHGALGDAPEDDPRAVRRCCPRACARSAAPAAVDHQGQHQSLQPLPLGGPGV